MRRVCLLTIAALASLARPAVAASTHEVEAGETLWSIAKHHGCTVEQLRKGNRLASDVVRPGQRLALCGSSTPSPALARTVHVVAKGETLSHVAKRYGTSVAAIRQANALPSATIRVGQRLVIEGELPRPVVVVVAGQSVGRPHRGRLHEGVQLPADRGYYRRRPHWSFGARHVVDWTRAAVADVRRQFPRIHRLAIGDLSAERGGVIPGHRSHQSGRDIDLGLYFERVPSGYPSEFVPVRKGTLHVGATWALVHSLYRASKQPGGPEMMFLDYGVQKQLYEYARKQGISKKTLAEIFQYPDGKWALGRLVMHVPKHDDHLHVRFACAPDDDGCQ